MTSWAPQTDVSNNNFVRCKNSFLYAYRHAQLNAFAWVMKILSANSVAISMWSNSGKDQPGSLTQPHKMSASVPFAAIAIFSKYSKFTKSSWSCMQIYFPDAFNMPVFDAADTPAFFCCINLMRLSCAAYCLIISAQLSVEPSSTINISMSSKV